MCVIVIVILFLWIPFIQSMNLYEVFTYNHMAVMSIRRLFLYISKIRHRVVHILPLGILLLYTLMFYELYILCNN